MQMLGFSVKLEIQHLIYDQTTGKLRNASKDLLILIYVVLFFKYYYNAPLRLISGKNEEINFYIDFRMF